MTKDEELKLIADIHEAIIKAENTFGGASYGTGAARDFIAKWTSAIRNDLPIDCAADVINNAQYTCERLEASAKDKAAGILRVAKQDADALLNRARNSLGYARAALAKAMTELPNL